MSYVYFISYTLMWPNKLGINCTKLIYYQIDKKLIQNNGLTQTKKKRDI